MARGNVLQLVHACVLRLWHGCGLAVRACMYDETVVLQQKNKQHTVQVDVHLVTSHDVVNKNHNYPSREHVALL